MKMLIIGMELLDRIGTAIYEDEDPAAIFHNERPFIIEDSKDFFKIKIKVPFIGEEDFSLDKFGDEIVIGLGNRRKSIILPRFTNFLKLYSHAYTDGWLIVLLKRE